MTVINITLPFGLIKKVDDYSRIINIILEQHISVNILKFSTGRNGINILLDIPEDKITSITDALKKNDVIVNKKGRIIIDIEKCIDCGACISLCPTDALHMDEKYLLEYSLEKCIGCLLCIDSCPRFAIEET
ncbi:MAG: ferredoxin family protein [Candidatus Hermodarchaeota archaeon]